MADGANKRVTQQNYQEFIDLVVKARLNEAEQQMEWLKEGIDFVIDTTILEILSWEDVEIRACGPKNISIERLKKYTDYSCCSATDKVIENFWKMLEGFSQEMRQSYLRFVWGRSKLPLEMGQRHYIYYSNHMKEESFPIGHTCSFAVDLPPYKTLE